MITVDTFEVYQIIVEIEKHSERHVRCLNIHCRVQRKT